MHTLLPESSHAHPMKTPSLDHIAAHLGGVVLLPAPTADAGMRWHCTLTLLRAGEREYIEAMAALPTTALLSAVEKAITLLGA